MRVLFLAPYVPSLVRVRPYQLIRHLALLGHEVTLVCLAGRGEEPQALDDLRGWCREVVAVPTSSRSAAISALRALPTGQPLQAAYGASQALQAEARRRADAHDVVHIEHLRGSSYGAALREHPLVLDSVDCISLLFERALRQSPSLGGRARALLDLARTRRAEARYGETFAQVVVTSEEDAWALRQLQAGRAAQPSIDVVPNGVDLAQFEPDPSVARDAATLVLSGKMSYHANVAAALLLGREIMPLMWRERRDVRCLIVGRDPPPAVAALARDPRIVVTGSVPSVQSYLRRATLAVAPLRYSVGIQNKVLEAMAGATPVVATPPAARALGARPGSDLAVAATPEAFAREALALLEDAGRRAALGAAGRAYVERHHDWQRSADALTAIYRDAAGRPAAGAPLATTGRA